LKRIFISELIYHFSFMILKAQALIKKIGSSVFNEVYNENKVCKFKIIRRPFDLNM